MNVQGKAAIVTGGGTGVGRATTLALAKLGCHVLVNYSRSAIEAEQTAADARAFSVQSFAHQADVANDDDCRAMVAAAVEKFGRLDVLVNCAGTTEFIAADDLDRVTGEMWDRIMGVNVRGPFQCAARRRRRCWRAAAVASSMSPVSPRGSRVAVRFPIARRRPRSTT